jgi:hypothetical protein
MGVMEAGRPYDLKPTGPSDIRRIEGGTFNWGADMTYGNTRSRWGSRAATVANVPFVDPKKKIPVS